jgi:hypothetical protein
MADLTYPQIRRRAERVRLDETTPVVLRFPDGNRASGKLQVISTTGGLLCLPRPLNQGSVAKLMFLTRAGSVLGVAEMLSPVSWDTQPFRFMKLSSDDESRLQAAIQFSVEQSRQAHKQVRRERDRMENFRVW